MPELDAHAKGRDCGSEYAAFLMHDPSCEGYEFPDHQPICRGKVKYGHSLSPPKTWQKDKVYAFHQAVVAICVLSHGLATWA